jgi:hypothetical protein
LTTGDRKDTLDTVAERKTDAPLTAVATARDESSAAENALRTAVTRARTAGHTWQQIGTVLGTTRQAAFQRFGQPVDPRTGAPMAAALLPDAAERAVEVLARVARHRWSDARQDFDDTMAAALDEAGVAAAWTRVIGMVGEYEGRGEPFVRQLGDYTVVDVPLHFEAGEMTGRVSFHAHGRIAGLFILLPEVT